MKTVTLEEHYSTLAYQEAQRRRTSRALAARLPEITEKLTDLGAGRIAAMDEAGIDFQVLSLGSPGTEQLVGDEAESVAREANDYLAEAIKQYPTRYAGFAALPTANPGKAADELERRVREGFVGAVLNGHIGGRYLDDPFFWPILERAEALNVPIYIHPTPPPKPVIDTSYTGHYSQEVTGVLSTSGWGWHIETALNVLRLALGGGFDRYPKLQVIIGHLGEALPFMLQRINRNLPRELTKLRRTMADYLRENVNYTFSGFNFTPAFLDLFLEVGVDRIMFSVDYPYGSMSAARAFLEQLPVSSADKERIAHLNAEKLLRL